MNDDNSSSLLQQQTKKRKRKEINQLNKRLESENQQKDELKCNMGLKNKSFIL